MAWPSTVSLTDDAINEETVVEISGVDPGGDAGGDLDGSTYPAPIIANNKVTTAKIADSNVTTGKIADLNVTTGKLADSGVTAAKIATAAVGSTLTGGAGTALNRAAISGDITVAAGSNTAAITAGSIVSADFNSEAPQTWTPGVTGTGWALGNAGLGAQYIKHGRMGVVSGGVTFGSTTTFGTGHVGFTGFPTAGTECKVLLSMVDSSTGAVLAGHGVIFDGLTQLFIYVQRASGAYTDLDQVTSTVPWTWANGDSISWFGPLITQS
jgi:hypothetical protein